MARKPNTHKLTMVWNGQYGAEAVVIGTCRCGWRGVDSSKFFVGCLYLNHKRQWNKERRERMSKQ